MRQGQFLFCLCQRGAFTVFQMIFLFRCSFEPEAESRVWPLVHKWNNPSPTAGKPGRKILSAHPDTSDRTDKTILPYRWFARFLVAGYVLFLLGASCFHGFLFWSFLSNLPLLPFTSIFAPFSEPHQAVISVLGAKVIPGLDGNARSSLLFSAEISSPAGSISAKNLASPNPCLFKHPKRKRPMRQKDA